MNSEPAKTFSAKSHIYRKVLVRLFLGWLFLCVFLGAGTLWLEIDRAEQLVHNLALKELKMLKGETARNLEQIDANSREMLGKLAEQLIAQHFLMAEFYGVDRELILEALRGGQETAEHRIDAYRHHFPREDGFSHELHLIDGKLWMVLLLPLKAGPENDLIGYFEGVYQVDRETYATIRHHMARTLLLVSLGISFTTLLMYPIFTQLIKGVVKLSGELLQGNLELMNVLGSAIAARDSDTNSHNYRVTYYSLKMGEAVGLPPEKLRNLIAGAFLHDVGKIGIRDPILLKEDKLTPEEFEIMKTHVPQGVAIVNKSGWLSGARDVVEYHHEKFGGGGYPKGVGGEQIPIAARIFAIVDVFDALTSERPYKSSWTMDDAMAALDKGSGAHFDPRLLAIFKNLAANLYLEMHELDIHQLEAKLNAVISPYFFTPS